MKQKFKNKNWTLSLISIGVFLILWEMAWTFKWVDPLFISSPSEIIQIGSELFTTGKIYPHLLVSAQEFVLGLLLSVLLGILLGLIIGWYKWIFNLLNPLIFAFYSIPHLALFPLIMIWVGLGIETKILFVFLGAFFPILINTTQSVKNLDIKYIRLARSFGASDLDLFKTIALPSAVPFIMTGLRLAVPRALLGMIAGEFFASNKGLGYLIVSYGASFQTAKLLAVTFLVVVLSLLLTESVAVLEKRLQTWKPQKEGS